MSDGPHSFSSLVHSIAYSVQSAIQAKWVAVLLRSPDLNWYETSADTRPDAPFIKLRYNGQVAQWLEAQDAILRAADSFVAKSANRFDSFDEALFKEHAVRLAAPVRNESGLIGLLLVGEGATGDAYPVSSLNYLKSLSDVAGSAIAGHSVTQPGQESTPTSDDQLLRRMAHDLKGPLATTMTYLGLLEQNKTGNLTDDQISRIDRASRAGNRLHRLLNDFVDFARLHSGAIGLERTEFELTSLVAELTDRFGPIVEARGQQLRCTAPHGDETIWADYDRTAQMISVLVSNASRYSQDDLPIDLEIWLETGRLRVRVTDRGRGMNPDQLSRVFDPLEEGQPSRIGEGDDSEAGSGLGLVLARGFARLHGGDLTLQSSPGRGTIAEIAMPVVLTGEDEEPEAA